MLLYSITSFCQQQVLDINSTIDKHLKEFRKTIDKDANVFIEFNYDFTKNIDLQKHDYILEPYINPKKLSSKEKNFMVKFMIFNVEGEIVLRAINFKIHKVGRKKLEFINLMNGQDYK